MSRDKSMKRETAIHNARCFRELAKQCEDGNIIENLKTISFVFGNESEQRQAEEIYQTALQDGIFDMPDDRLIESAKILLDDLIMKHLKPYYVPEKWKQEYECVFICDETNNNEESQKQRIIHADMLIK